MVSKNLDTDIYYIEKKDFDYTHFIFRLFSLSQPNKQMLNAQHIPG